MSEDTRATVTGDTTIPIKTLRWLIGAVISSAVVVSGAGLKGVDSITQIEKSIATLDRALAEKELKQDHRMEKLELKILSINEQMILLQQQIVEILKELENRAPIIYGMNDRFTRQDAILLLYALDEAHRAQAIDIDFSEIIERMRSGISE